MGDCCWRALGNGEGLCVLRCWICLPVTEVERSPGPAKRSKRWEEGPRWWRGVSVSGVEWAVPGTLLSMGLAPWNHCKPGTVSICNLCELQGGWGYPVSLGICLFLCSGLSVDFRHPGLNILVFILATILSKENIFYPFLHHPHCQLCD